jgi:hypothetical protein
MAEISYTKPDSGPDYTVFSWAGATSGDTFQPVKLDRTPYSLSLQIADGDAWSASPSVAVQGSLDGVTYYPLQDAEQADIAVTANAFVIVREVPLFIRPAVSSGDSGTSLTVQLLVRHNTK